MAIKKMFDVSRNSQEPEERYEQPYEPQYIPTVTQEHKKSRSYLPLIIVLIVLAGIWRGLIFFSILPSSTFPAIDRSKVQAVFLNNGLIYFGNLKEINRSYVALDNGYYLRANAQQSQQGLNIVKLADEVHRPENRIYIPKSQISFWENLEADSPVTKLMAGQK